MRGRLGPLRPMPPQTDVPGARENGAGIVGWEPRAPITRCTEPHNLYGQFYQRASVVGGRTVPASTPFLTLPLPPSGSPVPVPIMREPLQGLDPAWPCSLLPRPLPIPRGAHSQALESLMGHWRPLLGLAPAPPRGSALLGLCSCLPTGSPAPAPSPHLLLGSPRAGL